MSRVLFASRGGALLRTGWPGRLAGALALAVVLALSLIAGTGQARAAQTSPGSSGALLFTAPNYQGVIGGPPNTRVTVHGASWKSYADVLLSLTNVPGSCSGAVLVNTYKTDGSGSFNAHFLWPMAANTPGTYYACATQVGKGVGFSRNTFTVFASSPASVSIAPSSTSAGGSVTVTGANWLPGPQTVNVVVVPCNTICTATPVAHLEVVAGTDGTFSQSTAISATAITGSYYVQATNTQATLSAVSAGPVQVAGRPAPTSIPSPGASPTPTHNNINFTPPSQTRSALKDALLAAGLGLLALLLLIGGITFFIGRSHGADAPTSAKQAKDEPGPGNAPEVSRRAAWRDASKLSMMGLEEPQTPRLPPPQSEQQQFAGAQDAPVRIDPLQPAIPGRGSDYPWEQDFRTAAPTLPTTPTPAADASQITPGGSPGSMPRRRSAFGSVQRIIQPSQPSAPPFRRRTEPPQDE